jgi:hypothetical protein
MINLTNITPTVQSFKEVCELNQVAMLNQLQKVPSKIIILMALSLAALISYIYIVPFIKEKHKIIVTNTLVTFATGILVFAIIAQSAITFNITEQNWSSIQTICIIALVIWIIIYSIKNKEKIKNLIRKMKE